MNLLSFFDICLFVSLSNQSVFSHSVAVSQALSEERPEFVVKVRVVELRLETVAEEAERKLSPRKQQEVVAQQSERNMEDDWFLLLEGVPRGPSYTPPGSSTSWLHWGLGHSCIYSIHVLYLHNQ